FSLLREKVTSKGGTTAKALEVMNRLDIDRMMDEAVEAALKRTAEMKALFR
ncbi:MAG: pyrroline-5-carboxylate reductase, partial [Sutterella sp.]|nr:pyrroline-5-carboxylate reductase [Sutterella sp.]